MSVKRPANSLVLMIPANEINNEQDIHPIEDMINNSEVDTEDVRKKETKKKVRVTFPKCDEVKSDINKQTRLGCFNVTTK